MPVNKRDGLKQSVKGVDLIGRGMLSQSLGATHAKLCTVPV